MKVAEIEKGSFYSDDRFGVREVTAVDGVGRSAMVTYRLISARNPHHKSTSGFISTLGTERNISLHSFAGWARKKLNVAEANHLRWKIKSRKIKISDVEVGFLKEFCKANEYDIKRGCKYLVPIEAVDIAHGIVKSQLIVLVDGISYLTDLGVGWLEDNIEILRE